MGQAGRGGGGYREALGRKNTQERRAEARMGGHIDTTEEWEKGDEGSKRGGAEGARVIGEQGKIRHLGGRGEPETETGKEHEK